jgi:hypothetical protein
LVAAVVAAAPVASAASARAASIPTWKVDKVLPAGDYLNRLSAVSASDVWAVGNTLSPAITPLAARWNGRGWQSIPAPAGATGAFAAVAATSAANAWAFLWPKGSPAGPDLAEHWTGRGWAKPVTLPANVSISAAAAAGPSSVWAFGTTTSGAPYALRYNGSKWSPVSIPATPLQVSVISATDIWAIASVSSKVASQPAKPVIEHWNGAQWKTVALPHVSLASQHVLHTEGIVAFGPGDVWAEFSDGIGMANRTIVLAHLTSHGWTILRQPSSAGVYLSFQEVAGAQLAGNAKAGLWTHAAATKGGYAFVKVTGTHWQVVPDPGNALGQAMAAVPGASALVALGTKYLGEPNGPVGVILANGL